MTATMCANVFINGAAFLLPTLNDNTHLAKAGLLTSMPSLGMATTMIMWGYVVDRVGERIVLTVGMAGSAAAIFAAASADSLVAVGAFLFVGGMAGASNNAASGRLVVGWFPPERRGLAMGIRQMASPLGVALAALVIPQLAQRYSVSVALLFPATLCAVSALLSAAIVRNPPRVSRLQATSAVLTNPLRESNVLWRIHAASILLAVPQSLVWTFTLVWLMDDRGWSAASAGILVTVAQILGALGRVAAGHWSDHLGARLRPIRTVGLIVVFVMLLLALTDHLKSPLSVVVIVVASVITVTDNGLSFLAIAEIAGPYWSGRALGVQYTGLLLAGSLEISFSRKDGNYELVSASDRRRGVLRLRRLGSATKGDDSCPWCYVRDMSAMVEVVSRNLDQANGHRRRATTDDRYRIDPTVEGANRVLG